MIVAAAVEEEEAVRDAAATAAAAVEADADSESDILVKRPDVVGALHHFDSFQNVVRAFKFLSDEPIMLSIN